MSTSADDPVNPSADDAGPSATHGGGASPSGDAVAAATDEGAVGAYHHRAEPDTGATRGRLRRHVRRAADPEGLTDTGGSSESERADWETGTPVRDHSEADDSLPGRSPLTELDDTPGGYDRPRDEVDLESTQAMAAYDEGTPEPDDSGSAGTGIHETGSHETGAAATYGETSRRVTRDELYAREDRQGERDRLDRARAEHHAGAMSHGADDRPGAGILARGETAIDQEPVPAAAQPRTIQTKPPRTTDKFFGSLGLFVLRVITGVVMGVHGVQKLLDSDSTVEFFGTLDLFGTPLPEPTLLAIATGAAEALIGVSLVFGLLTRLSGFGVLIIATGALLMVKMTTLPNPFATAGASGFDGELELLLAAVGLLLLVVGGGGWGLDRLFRRRTRTDALDDEI